MAMEMAVESMAMISGGNSPFRQGAGTEFCPPETWFRRWRRLRDFSWKMAKGARVFHPGGIYGRRGGAGRGQGAPHATQARPEGGPRLDPVWAPCGPHAAPLLAPGSFWYFRTSGFYFVRFREYFICNFSETKNSRKQELALWHLVNRLVPENANYCIKVHIKHVRIVIKQAWSIKNYRCICNASTSPSLTPARPE